MISGLYELPDWVVSCQIADHQILKFWLSATGSYEDTGAELYCRFMLSLWFHSMTARCLNRSLVLLRFVVNSYS